MSKRNNLYKAMEEISDEHLKEAAQVKLKRRTIEAEETVKGFQWRRVFGGLAAASCVAAVLAAATYNIWHQQNDTEGGQMPGGSAVTASQEDSERKGTTASADGAMNTSDAGIIWAQEGLKAEECQILEGIYLEFEENVVMLLTDNKEPVVISNWGNIEDQVEFQNFDMVRIYMAPDSGIEETYPGRADIAGVSKTKCGVAQLSENIEETLKRLEEMGYILKK